MYQDLETQIAAKSNEDLIRIYMNPDHFQTRFVELATEELEQRGVDLSEYQVARQHREEFMMQQLEKGRPGDSTLMILGFIFAICGGFLGIVAGYVYSQSKHKDIGDGSYYVYDKKTRDQGAIMLAIGVFVLLFSLGYKYLN